MKQDVKLLERSISRPQKITKYLLFIVLFALIDSGFRYAGLGIISIESFIASIFSGVFLSIVLGFIFSNMSFRKRTRIGLAWFSLFIVQHLSNTIEAVYFTNSVPNAAIFIAATVAGLVVTFLEAVLTGILFKGNFEDASFRVSFFEYYSKRGFTDWIKRILLCSMAYFPIYYTFGSIIAPLVLRYYNNPTPGIDLVIPPLTVIIPLEFLRGFLYVLALLPIISSLKLTNRTMFFCIASFIYIVGAFVPFIAYSTLPVFLRLIHGSEILADSIVYGGVMTYLLARP